MDGSLVVALCLTLSPSLGREIERNSFTANYFLKRKPRSKATEEGGKGKGRSREGSKLRIVSIAPSPVPSLARSIPPCKPRYCHATPNRSHMTSALRGGGGLAKKVDNSTDRLHVWDTDRREGVQKFQFLRTSYVN